jgi:hypothetical protein
MNRPWRFSIWKLMVAVAVLSVLLGFCVLPVFELNAYHRLQRQTDTSIRYLRPTDPQAVSPVAWECASGWTITAYGNICFSPEHVSYAELCRFRDDLDRKLAGKIDPSTLIWIWDRLAETGPHGQRYVRRFKPIFLAECLPSLGSGPTTPPSVR